MLSIPYQSHCALVWLAVFFPFPWVRSMYMYCMLLWDRRLRGHLGSRIVLFGRACWGVLFVVSLVYVRSMYACSGGIVLESIWVERKAAHARCGTKGYMAYNLILTDWWLTWQLCWRKSGHYVFANEVDSVFSALRWSCFDVSVSFRIAVFVLVEIYAFANSSSEKVGTLFPSILWLNNGFDRHRPRIVLTRLDLGESECQDRFFSIKANFDSSILRLSASIWRNAMAC